MMFDTTRYAEILTGIAKHVKSSQPEKITKIGAFGFGTVEGRELVCSAVVVDISKTPFEVVESKTIKKKAMVPYIPKYTAFRFAPAILELYYALENEPDILFIEGEGIAHPDGAGIASYVGVELAKASIGIATDFNGEIEGDDLLDEGKIVGKKLQTRQYSKPVFVSIGHLMDLDTAVELVNGTIVPPHKLPEPLHIAQRVANKAAKKIREGEDLELERSGTEEPLELEA